MRSALHPIVWMLWASVGAIAVQLAPNPAHVMLLLVVAALIVEAHGGASPLRRAFPILVGVGVLFGAMKVLLTVLTSHGMGPALFTVPELRLPALLGGFTVGGTVEGPVLAQATSEALAIVGVMAAFGAFNAVAEHDELLRVMPRAFHEPGVALTVGLAFVPSTVEATREVRESDLARCGGRALRRRRLLRTALPVLERGMERAALLAESMDARGFGRGGAGVTSRVRGAAGTVGSISLAAGMVGLVAEERLIAALLFTVALGAIVTAVACTGRSQQATRYRPRRWARDDTTTTFIICIALMLVLAGALRGGGDLRWPAEEIALPGVDGPVVVGILLLAVPAVRRGEYR